MFSKALLTDLAALLLVLLAYLFPMYHEVFLLGGLFALSGALTNQLAIYMLFERVPLLYGSGIIEKHFEEIKDSIAQMMMTQFFNPSQLRDLLDREEQGIDLSPLIQSADFSPAFDALSKTVMESRFGAAIAMFGGEEALEGLREPFSMKLKAALSHILSSQSFQKQITHQMGQKSLQGDVASMIKSHLHRRLDTLTPKMVKELVQALIKSHLGWLVVWGGVFGALLGFVSAWIV